MPRMVTLEELRDRSMQLANVENDPSVTSTEVIALVNTHMPAVYDLLVAAGPADYYSATQAYTTVEGTIEYDLPEDFLSLIGDGVFAVESTERRRIIDPMRPRERANYRSPVGAYELEVEYLPTCPELTALGDEFDGVNGWDDLVVARVALAILGKREGDPTVATNLALHSEKRIRAASTQRTRGMPKYITDVESYVELPRSVPIDAYRLRGSSIEFYSAVFGWP